MSIPESEEKEIYNVINNALLALCEQKPNDPVDFLSRKMLELIGEDPTKAVRKKEDVIEDKENPDVLISPEKLALKNLHQDFFDYYKILEEISTNTYIVEDLKLGSENGQKCVRIIDKAERKIIVSDGKIKKLINLSHPNLIKIFQILEDDKYLYVVHDYCPGKDLFTFLYNNRKDITENLIRDVLKQILAGLSYLHKQGLIHKGINPNKILIYNSEFDQHDVHVKISDFINHCESYSKNSLIYQGYNGVIYDPLFLAPEFFEGKYGNKVDIWSIGMLSYLLFVGDTPFKGNKSDILFQVINKEVAYPQGLNPYKRELLKKMLSKNPNNRLEAEELLKEEYFQVEPNELASQYGLAPGSVTGSPDYQAGNSDDEKEDKGFLEVMNNISNFAAGKNLRRSVLSYIVSRKIYHENDKKIRKIFQKLDVNHDGSIETKEIFRYYRKYFPGTSVQQWKSIQTLLDSLDTNKNGKVEYSEFLTAMNLGSKDMSKKTLKEIFDYYDENKNGVIEAKDIKELFEDTGLSDKQIHEMLDDVDLNGDREISFDEFYKLITVKI